jgi:hypothetical protein
MLVLVGGCASAGAVWMSDLRYIGKHQFSIYKIINIYEVLYHFIQFVSHASRGPPKR